jgi:small basic protein
VIALAGLIVGALLGLLVAPDVPLWLQPYLPIAIVAALDALFGALRALLDGSSATASSSCRSYRTS